MAEIIKLRKLASTDAQQLVKLANNRSISNDMVTLAEPFTKIDAADIIRRSGLEKEIVLGVVEIATDELAGLVMLRDFEMDHKQAELSVWIGEPFWGKGYGTKAIQLMTEIGYYHKGLNRIYAYCMVRNIASQRILEKSGFTREGLLRERVFKNKVYEDVYIYAKLKRDK